jgi:hypothetical protein
MLSYRNYIDMSFERERPYQAMYCIKNAECVPARSTRPNILTALGGKENMSELLQLVCK